MLIKNGYFMDPKSGREGYYDVLTEGKRIAKISEKIETEDFNQDEVIDASGCIVAPGLVDVHVHFRDPGFVYKEDMETGAKAAAKGGFTTVVLMANTNPPADNAETLQYILEKGKKTGIHVKTCATITKGMKGKEVVPMRELLAAGAVGFTDDGIPIMDETLIREAMLLAKELNVPISLHEENPLFIINNGVNSLIAKRNFRLGGSPKEAEIDLVQRDLQIALETDAIINIQHISTKEAVQLVRDAKKKGKNIHAEATPHHFSLTQEAVIKYGTLAKMNPPLRTEEDRKAIVEGLADGTIDMIATDHAPHSKEEKERPLHEAPSGIIGLETALSLGITNLVHKKELRMMSLLEKMSYYPAQMYGLSAGCLEEEGPADILIFNPQETWLVETFASKSENSPFKGETLDGVIKYTICEGRIIYEQEGESHGK